MNYSKIGTQLKQARERKGLSHYQAFEVTRIQPSILKGIEEGTIDMAPVFLKSFIKTYCQFLGLNFDQLEWETQKKGTGEGNNKTNNDTNLKGTGKIEISLKNKLRYLFLLAGVLILFPLLFFLVFRSQTSQRPAVNPYQKLSADLTEIQIEEPQQPENATNQRDKKLSLVPHSLFEQITQSVFKQEILIQSSNQLKIYFKADNRSTVNKTLNPFTWYYIKARESLYLRFDDKLGAIQLFHNGEQLDLGSNNFFERKFE